MQNQGKLFWMHLMYFNIREVGLPVMHCYKKNVNITAQFNAVHLHCRQVKTFFYINVEIGFFLFLSY